MMREPDDRQGREAPPPDAEDLARIAERNRLIERVMEIDAKRRHLESLSIGISLELDHARRLADVPEATQAQREMAAGLGEQSKVLRQQLEKFAVEREWLARMLAEFDGAVPPAIDPRQGHA
jgi:hypothetical protein